MNHHMTSHMTDHVTEITSLNWKERRQFYKTHGANMNFFHSYNCTHKSAAIILEFARTGVQPWL